MGLGEGQGHALLPQLLVQLAEHLDGGHVQVVDAACIQDHHPHLLVRGLDELAHLILDEARDRKEERRIHPVDDQPGQDRAPLCCRDVVVAGLALHPAEHRVVGPGGALDQGAEREDHRDQDPLQDPEDEDGDHRQQRQHAFPRARPPQPADPLEVDQRDPRHDHHRPQRRRGQVGEDRRQEEEHRQHHPCSHHRHDLRAPTCGVVDHGARLARRDGEGPEDPGEEVGGGQAIEVLVGVDPVAALVAEAPAGEDVAGVGEERHAQGAGHQRDPGLEADEGQRRRGEPPLDLSHHGDARLLEAEPGRQRHGPDQDHHRTGDLRDESLEDDEDGDRHHRVPEGRRVDAIQPVHRLQHLGDETARLPLEPQKHR